VDFNDDEIRKEMRKPLPEGDFICPGCEEVIRENFKPEQNKRCWK